MVILESSVVGFNLESGLEKIGLTAFLCPKFALLFSLSREIFCFLKFLSKGLRISANKPIRRLADRF